jgi:hypothetical protein
VMRRIGMTSAQEFDHPGVSADHPVRPQVLYHLTRPSAARDPPYATGSSEVLDQGHFRPPPGHL